MFVGREEELGALERMYAKDDFQMAVIYGRRRVGKTSLIDEFVKNKPVLYFTAQQKTSRQNLALFSAAVYGAFSLPSSLPAFATWNAALDFVVERVQAQEGGRLRDVWWDSVLSLAGRRAKALRAKRRRAFVRSARDALRGAAYALAPGAQRAGEL